ncbi:unnamed protein product, partial [Closterium sp. NIES-53]
AIQGEPPPALPPFSRAPHTFVVSFPSLHPTTQFTPDLPTYYGGTIRGKALPALPPPRPSGLPWHCHSLRVAPTVFTGTWWEEGHGSDLRGKA